MDAKDVLTGLGGVEGVLMLAAIIIRFAGQDESKWGKRILALSNDLVGFFKPKKAGG